ncbi:hypothetical protein BN59_01196 [Legionella massiliensis]|uniref:Uncharacterized protein n=1 Tax=Legionella massiliensis TaxID=1034943 RepID=A0A078KVC6_9GAMM|nr:type IVB secretion system protein IcmM/DotJ [Legionella massiliensis]CDZ76917.1 hypothetical protein BN59_01196 [Legionella massiliensis]CEE12655.1 hypothetical protein BN1094_01196 [Legionella massiliensis]
MGRETWNIRIHAKFFYVRTYRVAGRCLILSLLVNLLLSLGVYYRYFHEPPRDYYATSGITPPVQLKVLYEPNYSATPLLPADPVADDTVKVIPD